MKKPVVVLLAVGGLAVAGTIGFIIFNEMKKKKAQGDTAGGGSGGGSGAAEEIMIDANTFLTKNGVKLTRGVPKNLAGLGIPADDPAYVAWQLTLPSSKIGGGRPGRN